MVPLRIHNILDYLIGAFLILSPWLFGFGDQLEPRTVFLMSGLVLIAYSLATNSYYSVSRRIPLGIHMTLDTMMGIFLILAPALLNYRDSLTELAYSAHVTIGILLVGLVALTRPRTEASKSSAERAGIHRDLTTAR